MVKTIAVFLVFLFNTYAINYYYEEGKTNPLSETARLSFHFEANYYTGILFFNEHGFRRAFYLANYAAGFSIANKNRDRNISLDLRVGAMDYGVYMHSSISYGIIVPISRRCYLEPSGGVCFGLSGFDIAYPSIGINLNAAIHKRVGNNSGFYIGGALRTETLIDTFESRSHNFLITPINFGYTFYFKNL